MLVSKNCVLCESDWADLSQIGRKVSVVSQTEVRCESVSVPRPFCPPSFICAECRLYLFSSTFCLTDLKANVSPELPVAASPVCMYMFYVHVCI
jgi:hypothetical protein